MVANQPSGFFSFRNVDEPENFPENGNSRTFHGCLSSPSSGQTKPPTRQALLPAGQALNGSELAEQLLKKRPEMKVL